MSASASPCAPLGSQNSGQVINDNDGWWEFVTSKQPENAIEVALAIHGLYELGHAGGQGQPGWRTTFGYGWFVH